LLDKKYLLWMAKKAEYFLWNFRGAL